ncbi:hypothetical protein HZS55_06095 [Halosimplex rubrum]|uniref:Sulfatase-like hydrolase/transferase n=1 Tax=Halosimplex rubrum TaxID=869889 RepID=A0A7D5P9D0_9EURY|nr:hypothetical protein [Halosimplex rubrum]QLH76899.1 hypothetical protein HZS55_06095 [Halosimplex rubrum]
MTAKITNHFKRILHNPSAAIGYSQHVCTNINGKVNQKFSNEPDRPIPEADWDTLFILDGCRYDIFKEEILMEGDLELRKTLASTSKTYFQRNYANNQFEDIVYVSANPFSSKIAEHSFHKHIPIYEEWDEDLETVHPQTVSEAVRKAHDKYPNKRIVGHYMQPHYPFIGAQGQEIDHRGYAKDSNWESFATLSIWKQLQFGVTPISRNEVLEAYRENLRIVLDDVSQLVDDLTGKIVMTADHGNLIGNRQNILPVRGYGHPAGLDLPGIRHVPWFILPHSTRRKIVAEKNENKGPKQDSRSGVEDQLRALGYRQ